MKRLSGKDIVLGTASWGWKTNKREARELVSFFTSQGFALVDTASNYPIDGNPANEGKAFDWLVDFYQSEVLPQGSIFLKVGAVDNSGNQHFDLRAEAFEGKWLAPLESLRSAIYGVGVHFDPRTGPSSLPQVATTVQILERVRDSGIKVGFSGVEDPELYWKASHISEDNWIIQVKENIVTNDARERYQPFFPSATFWAYGIFQSGYVPSLPGELQPPRAKSPQNLKINESLLRKAIEIVGLHGGGVRNFHDLALLYALMNPATSGIILGPRNLDQLSDSINFMARSERFLDGLSPVALRELTNSISAHFE